MPIPLAGFITSTAGKKLLFNASLSALASIGTSALGKDNNKSNTQRVSEVGVSTILGTAAATVLGPTATLGKQVLAGLGASQATSLLIGGSPGQDAIKSLINIADANNPFNDDSPATKYAKLNSPKGLSQTEYRRWYYEKTGR